MQWSQGSAHKQVGLISSFLQMINPGFHEPGSWNNKFYFLFEVSPDLIMNECSPRPVGQGCDYTALFITSL